MVSIAKIAFVGSRPILEVVGLAADTKPLKDNDIGFAVTNGSTFFCMDTGAAFMYDEDNDKWWEV